MKTLLVTGGAGFIGGNYVLRCLARNPEWRIVNLDLLTYAGNLDTLESLRGDERHIFVHADIADPVVVGELFAKYQPTAVVNFAAESHVDRSIDGPGAFITTNVVGTFVLLDEARHYYAGLDDAKQNRFRFHHVSTDEVFGSLGEQGLFSETTPYDPSSPYSASKAAADHLVRAWHRTYRLPATLSNCSNNYGPFHFPEKLIPLCITNILRGLPLPVYGDGSNIRDWLYVEDHCRGIELVLEQGAVGETYNIGGNNEWSNLAIVELLCDRLDARFAADTSLANRFPDAPAAAGGSARDLVTFVEDRAGHDWRYAIDARKAAAELGYAPVESFETGLERTLDWFLENEAWWRPLLVR